MNKYFWRLSIPAILILIFGCQKTPHNLGPISTCTSTTTLDYNDSVCSETDGCTLKFDCSSIPSRGEWAGVKNTIADFFRAPIGVTLKIYSININEPYLLQGSPGEAPSNWYTSELNCVKNGNTVECAKFHPIANNMTITGILNEENLNLNITVTNQLTPGGTTICGQSGTTVERIYDCSTRVTKYAGFGTGVDNNATTFVQGTSNPDDNWFLVSCTDTNILNCFWLSPVMKTGNPVLGNGQFDTFHNPMSNYTNSRLLWAGSSGSNYDFFSVNGNNPYNAPEAYYDYFEFVLANQTSIQTYSGPIYRPQSTPPTLSPILCKGYFVGNQTCADSTTTEILDAYDAVSYANDVCSTGAAVTFSQSVSDYKWQVPSYSMLMTLTGAGIAYQGTHFGCEIGGALHDEGAVCNPNGFRAIADIPGFGVVNSTGDVYILSSSASSTITQWFFINDVEGGSLFAGRIAEAATLSDTFVRCVSPIW